MGRNPNHIKILRSVRRDAGSLFRISTSQGGPTLRGDALTTAINNITDAIALDRKPGFTFNSAVIKDQIIKGGTNTYYALSSTSAGTPFSISLSRWHSFDRASLTTAVGK